MKKLTDLADLKPGMILERESGSAAAIVGSFLLLEFKQRGHGIFKDLGEIWYVMYLDDMYIGARILYNNEVYVIHAES